jgi:hypothetical protein
MPEGRRYSPESPSPAMQDFAQYIRDHGYPNVTDEAVAATSMFHKEWQRQHAERVRTERAEGAVEREAEKQKKAEERAAKKQEREEAKAKKAQEAEAKKAEKEAKKAEKEAAKGADGDDAPVENGEPAKTRRRLRTNDAPETVSAGASEASF